MNLLPVILSGGSGTRLWPASRKLYPKQLIPLVGDDSLFVQTLHRINRLDMPASEVLPPLVICNEAHRFMIAQQASEAGYTLSGILLEPLGRNTAPALTCAAQFCEERWPNKDITLLVLPADHVIKDAARFNHAVIRAQQLAAHQNMVTFGIVPQSAHTGYGYIKTGKEVVEKEAFELSGFVEKPDTETAQTYLSSGQYLWNSGMFCLNASLWLKAIEQTRPKIKEASVKALADAQKDLDFVRLDRDAFEACPSDSIDYAVMENSNELTNICGFKVVSLDAGWNDLGAWSAVWEELEMDESGNALEGDVLQTDSHNNLAIARDRLIALVGVDNLVVVDTEDALLVMDKNKSQQVKQIVTRLTNDCRKEADIHSRVYRPWGNYEGIDEGERYQVKRIVVKPGASLSLQMHHHRAEHWIVVKGTAIVTRGEKEFMLTENESTYIPIGETHRLVNPGKVPLELIEVQSGSYLGEDDIVRLEDIYGRSAEPEKETD